MDTENKYKYFDQKIQQLLEELEANKEMFSREFEYVDIRNHLKHAQYWLHSAENKATR